MKKFLCFILCGILLLGLCSCEQFVSPLEWTEKTQNQIKQDYAKYHNTISGSNDNNSDDVIIKHYLGIYQKNAVALCLFSTKIGYLIQVVEEDIAGFHFTFMDTDFVEIYQEGSFMPLKEAYEKGIVSEDDVGEIHYLFNLGMDKELYDSVKRDYLEYHGDSVTEEDFIITYYFGTYQNDATAFIPVEYSFQCIVEQEIGGVHFTFPDSRTIYICHNKTISRLKEAYENGVVSKEDVMEIHDRFERRKENECNL